MISRGFLVEVPDDAKAEIQREAEPRFDTMQIRDLSSWLWSSIDNDTSRDLDQIEVAERVSGGIRLLIAIADVDSAVPIDSPIDRHAASETTSVYTGVTTFPMLPMELSTDLTSLNEAVDRLAVVVEMAVAADGSISSTSVYRALVTNKFQLTYNGVGPWLEGTSGPPPKVAASADLMAQLKLQDEAAQILQEERRKMGALNIDRVEQEAMEKTERGKGKVQCPKSKVQSPISQPSSQPYN